MSVRVLEKFPCFSISLKSFPDPEFSEPLSLSRPQDKDWSTLSAPVSLNGAPGGRMLQYMDFIASFKQKSQGNQLLELQDRLKPYKKELSSVCTELSPDTCWAGRRVSRSMSQWEKHVIVMLHPHHPKGGLRPQTSLSLPSVNARTHACAWAHGSTEACAMFFSFCRSASIVGVKILVSSVFTNVQSSATAEG